MLIPVQEARIAKAVAAGFGGNAWPRKNVRRNAQ
jgi:hypothetical protein